LILLAGLTIAYEGVRRLIAPPELDMARLSIGSWLIGGVSLLVMALGIYVYSMGRKYDSQVLIADGKHLLTDAISTLGGLTGLILVQWTGNMRLDPIVAIILAAIILFTSWKLLWQGIDGLMDRTDPKDDALIRDILDDAITQGLIQGYHKVRHRHTGAFHWVEMHLQVDGAMTVYDSHELASEIEGRIERALGQGNATAHVEPIEKIVRPS
jgi:cation diffusion facilitator family transporter